MSEEHINRCPLNMSQHLSLLKTKDNFNNESDDCCTILCCPIKTPVLILLLPCTIYNMCMNKYNKKYIC
jgi:hypothetical protein